jgi:hypothetical protein
VRKISAVGVMGISWTAYQWYDSTMRTRASSRFHAMFNSNSLPQREGAGGRKKIREKFLEYLNAPNNSGIIFITGREQTGVSTTIVGALQGRKNVAYVSWRDDKLNNNIKDLNFDHKLKKSFNLVGSDLREFLSDVGLESVLKFLVASFGVNLEVLSSTPNFEKTLRDVETSLKFAKLENYPRPVICIDDIGGLIKYQPDKCQRLMSWLVSVSVEMQLCDVIVADQNGWVMENIVKPNHVRTIVLGDLDEDDLVEFVERMPQELRDQPTTRQMLNNVGGHGLHISRLTTSRSLEEMREKYRELLVTEAKIQSNYIGQRHAPCFEKREVERILDIFLRKVSEGNQDPQIHVNRLASEARVSVQTLQHLGSKGLLYFDPTKQTVSVRNKLFLTVCQLKKEQKDETVRLEHAKRQYLRLLQPPIYNQGRQITMTTTLKPAERTEIEKQLQLIETQLALYDILDID